MKKGLLLATFLLISVSTISMTAQADQIVGLKTVGDLALLEVGLDLGMFRMSMSGEVDALFAFIPIEALGYVPVALAPMSSGLGMNFGFGGGVEFAYARLFTASQWFTSLVGSTIFRLDTGSIGGYLKFDVSRQISPAIENPSLLFRFGIGLSY